MLYKVYNRGIYYFSFLHYVTFFDKKLVPANFRKKIEPMVKKTEKVVKESAYRPSNQYTFNDDFLKNWV